MRVNRTRGLPGFCDDFVLIVRAEPAATLTEEILAEEYEMVHCRPLGAVAPPKERFNATELPAFTEPDDKLRLVCPKAAPAISPAISSRYHRVRFEKLSVGIRIRSLPEDCSEPVAGTTLNMVRTVALYQNHIKVVLAM